MLDLRARIITFAIIGSLAVALIVGVGSWIVRKNGADSGGGPAVTPPPSSGPGSTGSGLPTGGGLQPGTGLNPPANNPANSSAPTKTTQPTAPVDSTRRPERTAEQELVSIAYSFASVYGSYSNQGGYENIERLRFLMSKRMNLWASEFIARRSSTNPSPTSADLYYGITTTALSSGVVSRAQDQAVIKVQTQRKEVRGVLSNSRYILEDLTMTFVREEGLWKVDSAVWANQRVLGSASASGQ